MTEGRQRRSAKQVLSDYVDELLTRRGDPGVSDKLLACEIIAHRMSWHTIYWRCRKSNPIPEQKPRPEPWWTK